MTSQPNSQGGVEELAVAWRRRVRGNPQAQWLVFDDQKDRFDDQKDRDFYEKSGRYDVEPLFVHPKPSEGDRESVAQELSKHFGARPWNEMAEGRADLRRRIVKDGYDINEATLDDCYEAADAILALLASPAARRDGGEG